MWVVQHKWDPAGPARMLCRLQTSACPTAVKANRACEVLPDKIWQHSSTRALVSGKRFAETAKA